MTAFQLFTPDVSSRVCVTLLHSLWQVAALAAVAWVVARMWCNRSMGWAYAVNVCALLVSLACVPATYVLSERSHNSADVVPTTKSGQTPATLTQPTDSPGVLPLSAQNASELVATMPQPTNASAEVSPNQVRTAGGVHWASIWGRTAPWLVSLYAAGAVLMLLRIAVGIFQAENLRRSSHLVNDGLLTDQLRRLADAWSMCVVPALATAEHIVVPIVVGFIKPTILMPAAAMSGLSPPQLEMLLAHELAHVRRHDLWINLVQRLAEAALFFNPTLWLLSRRISLLREYCCDELACSGAKDLSDPSHVLYAQALLRVGEFSHATSQRQRSLTALAASGRSPSQLRRRVARLFGEPARESLQLSREALLPLSLVVVLILAQPVLNTLAENASTPENSAADEPSPQGQDSTEPAVSSPSQDGASTAISAPVTSADRVVAEARARTFGLQDVDRFAFKQGYRQANDIGMPMDAKADLESLWKARAIQVADSELDRNRHDVLLAWDGDRLVLESFSSNQPDQSWRQTHYWDGQQGWIGETSTKKDGVSKNVYRYTALDELMDHILPFYYPQWAAAGDRLPWGGPTVLLAGHNVDPALTRYQPAGDETIDGVLCDVYDGPERHEKIWVERATKLLKAVCRHHVADFSKEENWKVISEAAGRKFDNQQDYERWFRNLTDEQRVAFNARWSAATWKFAQPGTLAVFADYREVVPGVHWPLRVDRTAVVPNGRGSGEFKFYLAKIVGAQLLEFKIEELAANALPEAGIKVTDRTGTMPFEYVWTDKLDHAEVERLREAKLAEKRAEEEQKAKINATPIESIDDAIRILTEGPNTDPTKVWARAIKYLSEHPEQALPALIETLDREDRDHPISKLAFALRAIGDPRAVPALIRALPRTLLPSRSDYGLLLEDDDLLPFMQRHGIDDKGGKLFTYGRAFREVVGALRRLTGHKFNEMELNWISLQGSEPHRRIARQQFERVAKHWADWWEANWQTHVNDPAYSSVNLPKAATPESNSSAASDLPSGPRVELIEARANGIIQSANDTGTACFIDLDTERQTGWPSELPALGKTRLESPELRDWARREGFDLVGITYTPPGEEKPLYCLMPLDLKAWQITEEEHRALPEMIHGKRPYPLSRPVEILIPRRTIPKPRDPNHSGDSFLYVTRDGTAGVLRLTAQVTEAKGISGRYSSTDDLFEQIGFHRGVKYALTMISAPTVSEATAGEKRSEADPVGTSSGEVPEPGAAD